jgi:hypothetical protein
VWQVGLSFLHYYHLKRAVKYLSVQPVLSSCTLWFLIFISFLENFLGEAVVYYDELKKNPSSRQIISLQGRPEKGTDLVSGSITVEVSKSYFSLNYIYWLCVYDWLGHTGT